MSKILLIIQTLLSILLIGVVLLQAKGGGLGSAFGGSSTIVRTKRGMDKLLFNFTIIISFLFLLVSILNVAVAR